MHSCVEVAIQGGQDNVRKQDCDLCRILYAAFLRFFIWITSSKNDRDFVCSPAVFASEKPVLGEEKRISDNPEVRRPGVRHDGHDCLSQAESCYHVNKVVL